ncbi:MAG: hypothetical protein AB8G96_05790 [Phycisphaerales bacterium]
MSMFSSSGRETGSSEPPQTSSFQTQDEMHGPDVVKNDQFVSAIGPHVAVRNKQADGPGGPFFQSLGFRFR